MTTVAHKGFLYRATAAFDKAIESVLNLFARRAGYLKEAYHSGDEDEYRKLLEELDDLLNKLRKDSFRERDAATRRQAVWQARLKMLEPKHQNAVKKALAAAMSSYRHSVLNDLGPTPQQEMGDNEWRERAFEGLEGQLGATFVDAVDGIDQAYAHGEI